MELIHDEPYIVFAHNDRRSVAAMLQGRGDDRHQVFQRYRHLALIRDASLGEEVIASHFAQYCRAMAVYTNPWRYHDRASLLRMKVDLSVQLSVVRISRILHVHL